MSDASQYHYGVTTERGHHRAYLDPAVLAILRTRAAKTVFELGCGDGSFAQTMERDGFEVTAVDPSEDGVRLAKAQAARVRVEQASAYDDLAARFGTYPVVVSLEVVEHLYDPRAYARTLFSLLDPDGCAIVSTPYHSYLKNLALAVSGRMDAHFTALWDHGHIKFWSERTLTALLREAGFRAFEFRRVGRFPLLAKSMIVVAYK